MELIRVILFAGFCSDGENVSDFLRIFLKRFRMACLKSNTKYLVLLTCCMNA
jgi:hypothetical protein